MNVNINEPALLFPAISLIMLAYTNRFLAVAALIRNLHMRHKANDDEIDLPTQIKYLQFRLQLIKNMQFLGVTSILFALVSVAMVHIGRPQYALAAYVVAVIMLAASLVISLVEIRQSTNALEISLRDMKKKT